jgi:hypothetical protein
MKRLLLSVQKSLGQDLLRGLLTMVLLVPGVYQFSITMALAEPVEAVKTLRIGQITGISRDGMYINTKRYTLSADLPILDDKGHPRSHKDLRGGAVVKFQAAGDRITVIVLVTPK